MREAISSIIGRIGPAASLRTINDQLRGELPRTFFSASSETVSVDNDAALVLDSSPCHRETMTISPRHNIQFLPAYSPMPIPIENAFSAWKWSIKNRLAEPQNQILIKIRMKFRKTESTYHGGADIFRLMRRQWLSDCAREVCKLADSLHGLFCQMNGNRGHILLIFSVNSLKYNWSHYDRNIFLVKECGTT